MIAINVTNLSKAYKIYPSRFARLVDWVTPFSKPRHRLKWVLQNISLTVQTGEAVGIVGANGAGKSTLLKMLTGTTQPTTGSIQITGHVAALLELGIGFHPDFTGRQNVFMAGQLLGHSVEKIKNLMSEIEEFAEIGDYIDQPVRVYSSGMQVRLAFSVATAIKPDILIVDEALAVGDIFFQQKCFNRIRRLREQGTTLLLVTHALENVYSLCSRAILIEEGSIALDGQPKEVVDAYNARLVRRASQKLSMDTEMARQPESQSKPNHKKVAEIEPETQRLNISDNFDPKPVAGVGSYSAVGVEIRSVDIYSEGTKVESFVSENLVTIRIEVVFGKAFSDPHIGFQIRNTRGEVLFMTNTYAMRQHIGPVRPGICVVVGFSFRAALIEGQYTVTAGVANEGGLENQFSESLVRVQDACSFTVLRNFASISWAGIYNISPTCEFGYGNAEI